MVDFCKRCGWNDPDFGCVSPPGEDVWQCDLYRHNHPEEVRQFDESWEEYFRKKEEETKEYLEREDVD